MTLTKAYSIRERKTKKVHEDMNISIACRKTGFSIPKKYDQADHERHLENVVIWMIK